MGMGMDEFVAASGRKVQPQENGQVMFEKANGFLGRDAAFDAEEYFQAKRDEELGRWRWPINPDWVVREADRLYDGARAVIVLNEQTLESFLVSAADEVDGTAEDRAGRAFFEAHPERKPWEDANDGDIWELDDAQYLAEKGRFFRLPLVAPGDPTWRPAGFASNFTAGRRLWPEDAA